MMKACSYLDAEDVINIIIDIADIINIITKQQRR